MDIYVTVALNAGIFRKPRSELSATLPRPVRALIHEMAYAGHPACRSHLPLTSVGAFTRAAMNFPDKGQRRLSRRLTTRYESPAADRIFGLAVLPPVCDMVPRARR
jgi:hypothetical protein